MKINGGLAQLGERLPCKQEVSGSNPLISTRIEKSGAPIEAQRKRVQWGEEAERRERALDGARKRDGRHEGNEASADDGPIAQLARAHD